MTTNLEKAAVLAEQVQGLARTLLDRLQGGCIQDETLATVIREKAEQIEQILDAAIKRGQ